MKGNTVIFSLLLVVRSSQRQREVKASGKVKAIELYFLREICRAIFCVGFPTGLLVILFLLSNKPF